MYVIIHCYINKLRYSDIYMINVNAICIYINIQAIRIYDINHFVGICIGCEYAYTITLARGVLFSLSQTTLL